jgi:DNA-directed RNA polymerase subunit RPC12/RpoP
MLTVESIYVPDKRMELQTANASVEQIRCPGCGGVVTYDPDVSALRCKHCATQTPVPARGGAPGPRELPLRDGLRSAPRGYGTSTLRIECGECGAAVSLAAEERATRCTYCASPAVVSKPPDPDQLQPESLIPFAVSQARATGGFDAWLSGLWFRPGDLARMARVEGVHGVYLPYWTFDADLHTRWEAERGDHYYETEEYTEEEEGETVTKTRQVQLTSWRPARGQRSDHHDDHLVCASRGVREDLARELCTFDTGRLVPYSPGYLHGWRAEAYALDLHGAWSQAKTALERLQEQRCAGDIGGDTHRNLAAQHTFQNETFKHILLPLFVLAYRYNGRPYQVLVNGQTGEVVGKAPLSVWKVMALVIPINLLVLTLSVLALPLLLLTLPALAFEIYQFHKNWSEWFG